MNAAGPVARSLRTAPPKCPGTTMGHPVCVSHQQGDRFEITVRHHTMTVDQPIADGGQDTAPTPTELFVASLASCVAFYANRYLARHNLPSDGLTVAAGFEMATGPARVGHIGLTVSVPDGIPPDRRAALLAVASHCTVHNTLAQPPEVNVQVSELPASDR